MRRTRTNTVRKRPALLPVVAAVALLASPASQAQFFSSTGDNSSFPVNLFPINPASPVLNFTGNTVGIANSGAGTFVANNGGVLLADKLTIANGGTGVGGVTVTGLGTQVLLSGASPTNNGNRLEVGNWGIGSLSVTGGAVVDASQNAAGCSAPGVFCNSFIGNAAGSSGVLNISGAGSTVSMIGFTGIGSTAVFTLANDGFNFGTPGGTTNGAVNVDAGGLLNTQSTAIGIGPTTPSSTGTELGIGSVVVDGAGSRWVATRDTIGNGSAFVGLGSGVGGQGTVIVRNGGQLVVDDTGSSSSSTATLFIGYNGGQGSMTVTGTGSSLATIGSNASIAVGRSGATGQGTLIIESGATSSGLFLNVGRDGATGTLLIDGAGSQMSLLGVAGAAGGGSAFATAGRGGGDGTITVSNGGRLSISDNGGDSRTALGSVGFILGRDAGSTGTMTITGPGSVVEVVSTSRGVPSGTPDNFNPFVSVGFDNAPSASGQLTISNGGKLILTGNAVSEPASNNPTTFQVGGSNGLAGSGVATVTGAGSELILAGADGIVRVGRTAGSTGTLNVLDQARVASTSMVVGDLGNGTLNINNAQLALSGANNGSAVGAGFTVGRGPSGVGSLNMTSGATLTVDNNILPNGGFAIGSDSFVAGGTGTVALSGGSSIVFSGSIATGATVGRNGTGTLSLTGASTVDIGAGGMTLGVSPGGVGTLSVTGGSAMKGNAVNIGGGSDATAGGVGNALVSGAGSELQALGATGFIGVGRGGTGSLTVSDQGLVNAIVLSIGRSGGTGTLSVDNATIQLAGQQTAGFLAGAALGVGTGGGSGTATFANGSSLNITNTGSSGASIYVGGSPNFPLGTGTLSVTDSTVNVTAAPGLATVRIGHDGTGTATFTSSSLNLSNGVTADGTVIIAGLPGSVGTLVLNAGSVVNASYVGVGSTPSAVPGVQNPGGVGRLVLNDSTINTDVFEIGALGVLSGNNGVINATGDVIIGGIIDPGNSPGRIRVNCNLISLVGSSLILEIQADGTGGFDVDQLIIGSTSTFDLSNFNIVFSFLGDTDVNAFAAAGLFDLDTFLRSGDISTPDAMDGASIVDLSSVFAPGRTWDDIVNTDLITVVSTAFSVSGLSIDFDSGAVSVSASRVPEPATWVMMLVGLVALSVVARRQQRGSGAMH